MSVIYCQFHEIKYLALPSFKYIYDRHSQIQEATVGLALWRGRKGIHREFWWTHFSENDRSDDKERGRCVGSIQMNFTVEGCEDGRKIEVTGNRVQRRCCTFRSSYQNVSYRWNRKEYANKEKKLYQNAYFPTMVSWSARNALRIYSSEITHFLFIWLTI